MIWNALLLAWRAIRRNLMRSFLTILGIVIGVSAVITMVTLGNGATQSVRDQIAGMGSNLLMVLPGQGFGPLRAVAHQQGMPGLAEPQPGLPGQERLPAPLVLVQMIADAVLAIRVIPLEQEGERALPLQPGERLERPGLHLVQIGREDQDITH